MCFFLFLFFFNASLTSFFHKHMDVCDGAHLGGHSLMEHGHCLILVSSVAGPRMQIGEETRAIEENHSGRMRGTGVESLHQPSGRHDLQ